jgi:hypothetical protein
MTVLIGVDSVDSVAVAVEAVSDRVGGRGEDIRVVWVAVDGIEAAVPVKVIERSTQATAHETEQEGGESWVGREFHGTQKFERKT